MSELISKQLLDKYFKGKCTLEEKKRVLTYLEQDDLTVLDDYILEKGNSGKPVEITAQQSSDFFNRLRSAITVPEQFGSTRRMFGTAYSVAASIAIVIGCGLIYWLNSHNNLTPKQQLITVSNHDHSTKRITLTDGTQIWLNPSSSISYDKEKFADTSRDILLTGEAFFDVSHDVNKPFKVKTGNVITRVLGTAFNITAYHGENDIQILLLRGKVQIASGRQHVVLKPGQLLKYINSNEHIAVHEVAVEGKSDSFTSGKIVFDDVNLAMALARVATAYAIKIELKDSILLHDKMISGAYARGNPDELLRRMLFIHGLKFKKKGDHGYIIYN